jgi:hypothetical protein
MLIRSLLTEAPHHEDTVGIGCAAAFTVALAVSDQEVLAVFPLSVTLHPTFLLETRSPSYLICFSFVILD